MDWNPIIPPRDQEKANMINNVVNEFMSQGKFDELRRSCLADMDTKPAYKNLQEKVDSTIQKFLRKQYWRPEMNKNQLRDNLKRHVMNSHFFKSGIDRLVDQIITQEFLENDVKSAVQEFVDNILGIKREKKMDTEEDPVESKRVFEEVVVPGEENWLPIVDQEETKVKEEDESDVSISNQMSPISVSGGSPKNEEKIEIKEEKFNIEENVNAEIKEEEKMEVEVKDKEKMEVEIKDKEKSTIEAILGNKKPSQFMGKIPKIKKNEDEKKDEERKDRDRHSSSKSSHRDRHKKEDRRDRKDDRKRDDSSSSSSSSRRRKEEDRSRDKERSRERRKDEERGGERREEGRREEDRKGADDDEKRRERRKDKEETSKEGEVKKHDEKIAEEEEMKDIVPTRRSSRTTFSTYRR